MTNILPPDDSPIRSPGYEEDDFSSYGPYSAAAQQPQGMAVRMPDSSPIVSYVILGLTVLVFLLQKASESFYGFDLPANLGLKVNELIIGGQFWRLITPVLLHGSILHIGFNMYALYIFGPGLERHYGHMRFLALYLLSGFAGNVMSFLFSTAPSLGASTAIFGLLGAEGVFLYQNRKLFGSGAQRALGNIVLMAVINLMLGLNPGIDNWGHLGGLIGGTLFAWFGGPLLTWQGNYPSIQVVDRRKPAPVVLAWFGVAILFLLLVVVRIARA